MKKKKVAIYIGRFAPPHKGHEETIQYCLNKYDETIVFIGSQNKRRTLKNPFKVDNIIKWIYRSVNFNDRLICKSINDYLYSDNKWIAQIEDYVYSIFNKDEYEFTIVGHIKDDSSYYLRIFPTWKVDLTPEFDNGISATDIRNIIFMEDERHFEVLFEHNCKPHLSDNVANDIIEFRKTQEFKDLMQEQTYFQKEDAKFANYPYKDTLKFNCSDAVVVCDGNVLLIERTRAPGKGTWALPGGFVNKNETYEQAAIRELFEETCLKVPEKVLKGSLKRSKIFDSPKRNEGIPRITNAFYFEIQPDYKNGYPKLPKVKGSDDAVNAKWFSLAEVRHMTLFDDHADIIDYFTNSY
jgi:bifunctional NMN adenylyltransferase/nudix hydrolase